MSEYERKYKILLIRKYGYILSQLKYLQDVMDETKDFMYDNYEYDDICKRFRDMIKDLTDEVYGLTV